VGGVVLSLLGSPAVTTTDGHPLGAALGAKALGLLAYLTLESRPHSREELAGLLWGESPEQEARASLRQALKQLRAALGDIVRCDRTSVELAGPVECDVLEFRRLAAEDPRQAVAKPIPRFLAGFSVRHAPRFEDWVGETRTELQRLYERCLAALARESMGRWDWRDAAALADCWLASDPLSEEAARIAVEARFLSGDRGAALRRFSEYRATLQREVGCEPGRAILGLVRRVEADTEGQSPRPVTDEWYARAPSFEASLIGREEEWGSLVKGWNLVARGGGRIVLVEGEAGVGKSRLAEDFLRWVVAAGGTVLRGRGYDSRAGIPFGPLVEVLRDALGAPGIAGTDPEWLTEVARLLPEIRQQFPGLAEPALPADSAEGWRLVEGIAQLLTALAAERPVAVSIDDLHWCDDDSCNLLRFLTRRLERAPIMWLGTITLGELERDAPAARLCRALRAKAHAQPLTLGPLNEEQVWRLVREMGHVSTPTGASRFAKRIFRITGGNAFYIIELLKTMFAQGLLATDQHTGEWTVSPTALEGGREFPVSQTVHDVIAERVERLPDELRAILITIAVAGTGCSPEVLSHVHGISRLHSAALGDALVDRRLVVEEDGSYRCAHPVIAHVVRDGLSTSRRREVHRMLALALELVTPAGDARNPAGEIARHADRGGETRLAYRFALLASEAAIQRYAFAEALSWLDLAAGAAQAGAQADEVNRLTAEVLEVAGWSEAPPGIRAGGPITREIVGDDLDLPVRG
jgi:DNA-binding SARP family transcriptional activator